ncbi:hypothetical protein AJ80_02853 [Polytolypa hystricis UAMH7299]|uniref:Uncharacterized protein n=1 Tax=Polytolypa hystricis (strain UAMH7299) TaxID=1447883 RepID=A0A2B7YPW7_POLH7|nr:hypothetical protein AJ80_02853 [Polytolypa hystricis UAMH7299]
MTRIINSQSKVRHLELTLTSANDQATPELYSIADEILFSRIYCGDTIEEIIEQVLDQHNIKLDVDNVEKYLVSEYYHLRDTYSKSQFRMLDSRTLPDDHFMLARWGPQVREAMRGDMLKKDQWVYGYVTLTAEWGRQHKLKFYPPGGRREDSWG